METSVIMQAELDPNLNKPDHVLKLDILCIDRVVYLRGLPGPLPVPG